MCSGSKQLASNPKELDKLISLAKSAYKQLYKNGSYTPEDLAKYKPYQAVINETNRLIRKSVDKEITHEIPAVMREALQRDVFLFSALKTHAQLFEVSQFLTTPEGTIRSAYQFEQLVLSVNENYNINYLDAERNYAISAAQSAASWVDVDQDGDRYNLQYRTALDDKVREVHREMEGITLPVSDPFWKMYYPPNGWRCRCKAPQVLKDKYDVTDPEKAMQAGEKSTTKISASGKNSLEIFRFNPGNQKVIFPPAHPYSKVRGAEIVKGLVKSESLSWTVQSEFKNGGAVLIHELVEHGAPDFNRLIQIANSFAKSGSVVQILPRMDSPFNNPRYAAIYGDLQNTKYWGKCPDLKIDGNYFEHEGFTTDNQQKALKNMLNRGTKQSNYLIIEDCGLGDHYVKNRIFNHSRMNDPIEEAWVVEGSEVRLLFKNTKASQ